MEERPDYQKNNEISLKDLILNIRKWIVYTLAQWKIILIFLIAGGVVGFFYASNKDTLYKAESTFVLDEGKSGNSSALNGLAFLGMDMGNASAGLFTSAKNIIWLYKSRLMLHQTLMTAVNYNGHKRLLIDILMDESGVRKKINKVPALKHISFKEGMKQDSLSADQSSIVLSCVGLLKGDKYLDVSETSKAENLITVTFKSKDEQFSKLFTETLVNNVNQYYIKTKTEKTGEEIRVLEQKADSARLMLNSNMYQVASSIEDAPYANPLKATLRVAPERKKVDVEAASAMYIELAKNLESRRMALAQETPLIQIVDAPVYPLEVLKPSGIRFAIIGSVLFALLATVTLVVRKWYLNILRN